MSSSFRSGTLALVLLAAAAGCSADAARPATPGNPAPAFAAPTLDGDTISLASLQGSPVLLNVWATWCPPCRAELPALQKLQDDFAGEGLRVVAVSIDGRAAVADVRQFAEDMGLRMMILHDPDENITQSFRLTGVPHTFLIAPDGTIAQKWVGEIDAGSEAIRAPVRRLLAGADAE